MRLARRHSVRLTAAAIMLCSAWLAWPTAAAAQGGTLGALVDNARNAVGVGLWYSQSTIHTEAAPDGATAEVRGYTSAMPDRITSRGPSFGISFGDWGLNLGFNEASADVNARADVNQTPGNPADDPYVISLRRTSSTVTVLYSPLRWLYVGYGKESGTMQFEQVSAAGAGETRRIGFSHSFYSFGLALGFDPRTHDFGLVFTLYGKMPAARSNFAGSEFGAGVGFYL